MLQFWKQSHSQRTGEEGQSIKKPTYGRLTGNRRAGIRTLYFTSGMMNWNKKDVNTKTETEQETQKPVKEDRELGLLCTHMQF